MKCADLEALRPALPNFITRKDVDKYFGSLISVGYLANLDSMGQGPKRQRIGKKIVYKREDFLDWLDSRWNEA